MQRATILDEPPAVLQNVTSKPSRAIAGDPVVGPRYRQAITMVARIESPKSAGPAAISAVKSACQLLCTSIVLFISLFYI